MRLVEQTSRWRTAVMIAGVVAIWAAVARIPLPGLYPGVVALPEGLAQRLSIGALGIAPYFTILTLAEIARLIAPPLARWEAASPANRRRLMLILAGLALVLAAAQGLAIADALQLGGLTTVAPAMVPWQVAALVAGTAAMIWLARLVRLPGLRDGFWLLVTLPVVTAFPAQFGQWIDVARSGGISPGSLLAAFGFVVAAVMLTAFADIALRRSAIGRRTDWPEASTILLWPPFVAAIVVGPLLALGFSTMPMASVLSIDLASTALTAVGIGAFAFFYARRGGLDGWTDRRVLLAVVAIQVAIVAGATMLPHVIQLPMNVHGGSLVATTIVTMAMIRALRPDSSSAP